MKFFLCLVVESQVNGRFRGDIELPWFCFGLKLGGCGKVRQLGWCSWPPNRETKWGTGWDWNLHSREILRRHLRPGLGQFKAGEDCLWACSRGVVSRKLKIRLIRNCFCGHVLDWVVTLIDNICYLPGNRQQSVKSWTTVELQGFEVINCRAKGD